MVEKLRNIDRKILAMLIFLIVVIIIFIVAMVVISSLGTKKSSYSSVEKTMVNAAKKYYKDNPSLLPKESGKDVEVESTVLVSGGYMKEISEYTKGVECTGSVIVGKTKDGYDYAPYLDCGDKYKTALFYKKLIEKQVTSGDGLYAMSDFITSEVNLDVDEDGYDLSKNELLSGYMYRGQLVDNYLSINGNLYRIVKIDGNNDITIIQDRTAKTSYFDNRYNTETEKASGINEYGVSRINDYAKEFYQDKIVADSIIKTKGVAKNVCVGARSEDDTANDGSIECAKVLKNTYVSLLPVYDVINSSLSTECTNTTDPNCGNYSYLTEGGDYWTMTPNSDNSYTGYKVNKGIKIQESKYSSGHRYVFYLTNKLIYVSGTGTKKDPYIVK